MNNLNRVSVSVFILTLVVGVLFAGTEPPAGSAPASRDFTFSDEPGSLVLYVSSTSVMTGTTRAMSVYGDGKIELRKERRASGTILGSFDVQVERVEVELLLQIAVDHGLVDWDPASIRVRQMRTGKSQTAGADDSSSIDLIVTLESYGDRQGVGREIRGLRDLRTARILYPDFPEYKGILDLMRYMSDAYRQAENGQ